MIVTTVNVNGVRAAVKERSTDNLGLFAWLKETRADVVCLQETRADDAQIARRAGARHRRRLAPRRRVSGGVPGAGRRRLAMVGASPREAQDAALEARRVSRRQHDRAAESVAGRALGLAREGAR